MIPVGEWRPDLPELENPGSLEAKNVIPAASSYKPFPSFVAYSSALANRAQGGFATRNPDATGANFAGDAAKLYRLDGAAWVDATRTTGGGYATGGDGGWSFAQFGDLVIAVNGVDACQKFQLGVSTNFAALGGTPPSARFAATVRDFVVLGRIPGNPNRIKWSGINNAETWTPDPTTQSDQQDLPDGGWVQGIVGGEFGTVFQERSIKRMTYIGAPLVFQFDEIGRNLGATIEGAIASWENNTFFVHTTGFYALVGAQTLQPIGDQKVDRYFWNDIDQGYLHRVAATVDHVNKLYVVSYPGSGHAGGTPNKLLVFNWAIGRWSRAEVELEYLYTGLSQSGYTLEDLDAFSASLDALNIPLDSPVWTGVGRQLLAGFDTGHRLGYFTGGSLAATVETTEAQLIPGRRAFIRSVRPIVDGGPPTLQLGTRNRTIDPVAWGTSCAVNGNGACPVRSNGRYQRARIMLPAGAAWSHIQGIDEIEASGGGRR